MALMQENKIKIHQQTIALALQSYSSDPEIPKYQAVLASTQPVTRIRHLRLAMQGPELEPKIRPQEAFLQVFKRKRVIWELGIGLL